MQKVIVSIIIPCYNSEKYLNRSITSVYEQDWPKIELIIVDDGSTDASAKIVKEWEGKFTQRGWILKYFYQENAGVAAAINLGLKEISGKYLSLLDAGDRYLDGSISKKVLFLEKYPSYPAVRSNGWIVKENNKWLFVYDDAEKKDEDVFTLLMEGKTNNWAGSYMLRTDRLFGCYPSREIYSSRYGQNLQLLLAVTYKSKCAFIDEPLMEYIQIGNSLSRENDCKKKKEKALKNAYGFHDIRMHVIDELKMQEEEKKYWRKSARKILNESVMKIAVENGDIKLLEQSVEKLKSEEMFDLNDKIYYWNYKFKPCAYVLRIIRRILNDK